MLVLKSIWPLFWIGYVFAAPSTTVSWPTLEPDKSPMALPSSLEEKTSAMVKNEQDGEEFPPKRAGLSSLTINNIIHPTNSRE